MRDKQGHLRGRCMHCECADYVPPETGHACDYCDHKPTAHALLEGSAALESVAAAVMDSQSSGSAGPPSVHTHAYVPDFYGVRRLGSSVPTAVPPNADRASAPAENTARDGPASSDAAAVQSPSAAPAPVTAPTPASSQPVRAASQTSSPASPPQANSSGTDVVTGLAARGFAEYRYSAESGATGTRSAAGPAPLLPAPAQALKELNERWAAAQGSPTGAATPVPPAAQPELTMRVTPEELDLLLRARAERERTGTLASPPAVTGPAHGTPSPSTVRSAAARPPASPRSGVPVVLGSLLGAAMATSAPHEYTTPGPASPRQTRLSAAERTGGRRTPTPPRVARVPSPSRRERSPPPTPRSRYHVLHGSSPDQSTINWVSSLRNPPM